MLEINLGAYYGNKLIFEINFNNKLYINSLKISALFSLDVDTYNKLLIEKVIQHEHKETLFKNGTIIFKYVAFELRDTPTETYLNRFKETFAPQLALLTLGGAQ